MNGHLAARGTVAPGFVSGMLSGLAARGHRPRDLLKDVGLPPDVIERQQRIPLTDYAALYNRVSERLDDEGFGLFSTPLRRGTFEFLCRVMSASRTLNEALTRAARFLRLVLPDMTIDITREHDSALIIIQETQPLAPRNDARRIFAFEWLLRLIHGLACWLARRDLILESVNFPYERPEQASDYTLIYTQHPTFGDERLVARLSASVLNLPISKDQDAVTDFLQGAPGKIAILYRRDHDTVRQVREIVTEAMPASVNLKTVAKRLHLSLRTVQRRLTDERTSFRAIKDAARRNTAIAMVEGARPIAEIAESLGYADPSAFYRAFVQWTGTAPTKYRAR